MLRKVSLVVTLIAATFFAGLLFAGSSTVPVSNAMTLAQNNNRDRDRGNNMGRRRHRRHNRRWHRHNRRHRRNGNGNME